VRTHWAQPIEEAYPDLNVLLFQMLHALSVMFQIAHSNKLPIETLDAQASAACIVAMYVIDNLAASPHVIKQVLSLAAVDVNHALSTETIATLEAYRD
jgi:hypothetical protein